MLRLIHVSFIVDVRLVLLNRIGLQKALEQIMAGADADDDDFASVEGKPKFSSWKFPVKDPLSLAYRGKKYAVRAKPLTPTSEIMIFDIFLQKT